MIPDPKHARTRDEHSPTPDERAAHSRAILKVKCGCEDCRSFAEAHDALVEALERVHNEVTQQFHREGRWEPLSNDTVNHVANALAMAKR